MNQYIPHLFLEIKNDKFIFLVTSYNEDLNLKILHQESINSTGIKDGEIYNLNDAAELIQNVVEKIEKKINYVFKEVVLIYLQDNLSCINISGFKKLKGTQLLEEDIFFILNNLKKIVLDNNTGKKLIHLFNSKYILDKREVDNMPIGLHGDNYMHQLSFFLMPSNDIKNLKLILKKSSLHIKKIFLRSFIEGVSKIKKLNFDLNLVQKKSFLNIQFEDKKSYVSYFYNGSYVLSQDFDFGTDIILSDVSKVCSLTMDTVKEIISEADFSKINKNEENIFLEKKFFKNDLFRKISISHINEIINARVSEIISLVYEDNTELQFLKSKKNPIYLNFKNKSIMNSLKKNFLTNFPTENKLYFENCEEEEIYNSCKISAELTIKGWEKEVIPVIKSKSSVISRLFSRFFG